MTSEKLSIHITRPLVKYKTRIKRIFKAIECYRHNRKLLAWRRIALARALEQWCRYDQ